MPSLPYMVVADFEATIAEWAGSRHAVAVESCSMALFFCCLWEMVGEVTIPKRTYPSVPAGIIHAGGSVLFHDRSWQGVYQLEPYEIFDGALRFREGMYKGGLHCLSFHAKKHLPIGRGGMILTDDDEACDWLKRVRFDGRAEVPLNEDNITMLGWNAYLTPEQASRGLMLFDVIQHKKLEDLSVESQGFPDLSLLKIYRKDNRDGYNLANSQT
jgi:dTDP-4-amino-4,6-dideoxygalactose transaminase